MANENSKEEKIFAFINGTLRGQEQQDFEHDMQADTALREAVKFAFDLQIALKHAGTIAFIAQMQEVGKQYVLKPDWEGYAKDVEPLLKKAGGQHIWIGVFVTGLLLVACGIWFWGYWQPNQQQQERQQALEQLTEWGFKTPYPNIISTDNANMSAALALYEGKDYANAAIALRRLGTAIPNIVFYQGISLMLQTPPNLQEAEAAFRVVAEEKNDNLNAPAQWYLAICLIRQNKIEEARKVLDILRGGEKPLEASEFKDSATILLKRLEKF